MIFTSGAQFFISTQGSLKAIGTAQESITFTAESPTPGYWQGIQYQNSNSLNNVLEHVLVEYGGANNGNANIHARSGTSSPTRISLKNVITRNSNNYGFGMDQGTIIEAFDNITSTANVRPGYIWANDVHLLTSSSDFTGNSEDLMYVDGISVPTVSTAQTWHDIGIPYLLESQAIRAPLTIEAGVELQFVSRAEFRVWDDGSLKAVGAPSQPITFTGEQKTPGYWDGIVYFFSNSVDNILDNTVVEYGGGGNPGTSGNIVMSCIASARLSISDSTIANSLDWGIYRDRDTAGGCNLSTTNITFNNNAAGNQNQ